MLYCKKKVRRQCVYYTEEMRRDARDHLVKTGKLDADSDIWRGGQV